MLHLSVKARRLCMARRAFASGSSSKRRRRRRPGPGSLGGGVQELRPEIPLLRRSVDGQGRPLITDDEDEGVARFLFRGTPRHVSSGYENLPGATAIDTVTATDSHFDDGFSEPAFHSRLGSAEASGQV